MTQEHEMNMAPTQRAGEMGPWWTLGIKIMLIVITLIVLPWAVWITNVAFDYKAFKTTGGRFTDEQAITLASVWDARFDAHVGEGGHSVMESRMETTERNQEKILENQTEILVAVGKMQQQLDDMKERP